MFSCTGPDDFRRPEWAFRRLFRAHSLAVDALFSQRGLGNIGQPLLLHLLSERRKRGLQSTQKELADILQIAPSTLAVSIKSLEKRGYVRKISDTNDMRRNFIEITPAGSDAADACSDCFRDVDSALYSGFSPEERAAAADILNRMADNLLALATPDPSKGSADS